jgi:hypothetical protein
MILGNLISIGRNLGTSDGDGDIIAPTLESAVVTNETPNQIDLIFSEALDENSVPSNLDFSISGTETTLMITAVVISGTTVTILLNGNILDNDVPLLDYSGSDLQDIDGNNVVSFTNEVITNNVGVLPVFNGNNNLQWLFTSTGFSGASAIEDRSSNNNDATLVKSHCLTSNGTLVFTFSSLAGITITSSEGTSVPLIVGNTITTTAGTIYHIVLSNGSILPCAEGSGSIAYDAINSLNGTLSGTVDWTATQDTYHFNILNGFSHLGRMDAINQYVTLTSNIIFNTTKFSIKAIYAPDLLTTTQDIWGTATTNTQFAIGSSAGAITGTLRMGSGTTYALTCASTAAAVGWANNTFSTLIVTRDALGTLTATINGFTLLINGAASVVDAASVTISQFMRTSTANSNIGILKEIEILDAATTSLIGTKYNADNSFLGTLQGGFTLRKYPKPMGGDVADRNLSGNWHNGAESRVKPNPSNNAALTAATGWDNTTELTYAGLDSLADPIFVNVTNPLRKRNLVVWETALPYEDELVANNFVGKTTINISNITGWSTANRLSYAAGSGYDPDPTGFTVKLTVRPIFFTTAQIIFGKTAAVSGNGFAIESPATNAAGADLALRVRDGSNNIVRSRKITFSEKEDDITVLHFGLRSDGNGGYELFSAKNGHIENTVVPIVGLTHATDNMVIGSFSGGNAYGGGILAVSYFQNKGMTDNEVEASYQQTKNNVYVQEDDVTLLFAGESGNANWVDRVAGTVTMTKSGTLTVGNVNQIFNPRWRPEDYPADTAPLALTPLPTPTIRLDGDSRVVGGFSQSTLGFRQLLRTMLNADPDISGATLIGSQGVAPLSHYGLNGRDSSTFISEAPGILSVNGTYPANIIVLLIGTNGMTSEVLFDREVTEWETLMFSYKRDIPNARFVIVEETEHDDANRRARSQDLMDRRCRLTIPTLRSRGYNIIYVPMWRANKHMDGDFIDVVHQNDQGCGKMVTPIFNGIKLAAGYSI